MGETTGTVIDDAIFDLLEAETEEENNNKYPPTPAPRFNNNNNAPLPSKPFYMNLNDRQVKSLNIYFI